MDISKTLMCTKDGNVCAIHKVTLDTRRAPDGMGVWVYLQCPVSKHVVDEIPVHKPR